MILNYKKVLKSLKIRNYALIDELELEFGRGLTIITGETGAGKSIMLGALSLLMGGRADTRVIADAANKSVVEALFVDVDPSLAGFFNEKGLDWTVDPKGRGEILIRREISASGRSKVVINDTTVTLQTLSALAPRLIDIHSQHANAKINDPAMRLEIIDSVAGNASILADYQEAFNRYVELRRKIVRYKKLNEQAARSREFLNFQLEGLNQLQPVEGELAEIERRFDILSDTDEIRNRLSAIMHSLGDDDGGALSNLGEAVSEARKLDLSLLPKTGDIAFRLGNVVAEMKDIYSTLEQCYQSVESDPATLARLSERMNLYYDAMKRYQVSEADLLVRLKYDIEEKLYYLNYDDKEVAELEREARELAQVVKQRAALLTESRSEAAKRFSQMVEDAARPLGLPNIRFEVALSQVKLTVSGEDAVEFLCSFNKNGTPQPLAQIASGGEISRMMLSMKGILAGNMNLPTIIFDEVDTGVSGEIADKMGRMMHDMGRGMQVIVITHLPQVAAKGEEHFRVYKTDEERRTVTRVCRLSADERVREIAKMISGEEVTPEALSAAKALLK